MGCSLGCLLRQAVFPLIGQHAKGLRVPQCVRKLLPGGSACALYNLAPGRWRCAEAEPLRILRDRSQTEDRGHFLLMICLEGYSAASKSLSTTK